MNSHLISKVLLRGFTNASNEVRVFDKLTKSFEKEPRHINCVGNIDLPSHLYLQLEQKWSYGVENKYANLIQRYHGDIFEIWKNDKNHPALRRLLALHFIRSFHSLYLLQKLTVEKISELLDEIDCRFYETVIKDFVNKIKSDTPIILDNLYVKVRSYLDLHSIEIASPICNERLIIGDIPIINEKKAVMNSRFFALPLSTKYIITAAKQKKYWRLTTRDTRRIKAQIKNNSIRYWYCYPDKSC